METRLRILALRFADRLWEFVLYTLQDYLTNVWDISFTKAATLLNIWGGLRRILPIFFLFLADTCLGNFLMLLISVVSYSLGMFLLTLSLPPVIGISTSSCEQYIAECIHHTQKNLFVAGMTLIGIGIAGQDASLDSFIKEQRQYVDQSQLHHILANKLTTLRRFIPFVILILAPVIGFLVFPYINDWFLLYGVSTICMAIAALLFLSGSNTYHMGQPQGSILTVVCRVFVAVAFKISRPAPTSPKQFFHQDSDKQLLSLEGRPFRPSRFLRWLEKGAIILPEKSVEEQKKNKWKLCSLAEVECAKIVLRMVPIWTTFITCAIVSSIGDTYFIEQALSLRLNIGKWKAPLQILLGLCILGRKLFDSLANRVLKITDPYGGPKGLGVAIIFSILCCIAAALVERRRLNMIKKNDYFLEGSDEPVPMSAYWLLFQIFLLAGLDAFFQRGSDLFIKHQAPEPIRKYLNFLNKGVTGVGFMFGALSVHVVGKISGKIGNHRSWFQSTLNESRLDKYYWVLTTLCGMNLLLYILVASFYRFDNWEAPVLEGTSDDN